jgi:membrane protein implicated in regulation of membrane protease activity
MISWLIEQLGPWNWMVLGMVLLAAEILLPGVMLLWIGIAALIVGALSLGLWNLAVWSWQVQVLVFLALSLASAVIGRRIVARRQDDTDQPLLNRRGEQLIGRTATLTEPIRESYGRIHVGDTVWRVTGPDLPAGTRVRVVGVRDMDLVVEAAE